VDFLVSMTSVLLDLTISTLKYEMNDDRLYVNGPQLPEMSLPSTVPGYNITSYIHYSFDMLLTKATATASCYTSNNRQDLKSCRLNQI